MSDHTPIEWTDASWPVVRGCSKISPGCENCWAIQDAHIHAGNPNQKARAHFEGLTEIKNKRPNWTGRVRIDESIRFWPRLWRAPRRIFVASSGDLFHESLTFKQINSVFEVMRDAPHHTYQILTKRSARMVEFAQWWIMQHVDQLPHNWQFGVSVEDQETATRRLSDLVGFPFPFRWVSYEPALGPVEWERWVTACRRTDHTHKPELGCWNVLNWGVCGLESGPRARPGDIAWLRSFVKQFQAAGVPSFVKQFGRVPYVRNRTDYAPWPDGVTFQIMGHDEPQVFPRQRVLLKSRKGSDMSEWPEDLRVRELPK